MTPEEINAYFDQIDSDPTAKAEYDEFMKMNHVEPGEYDRWFFEKFVGTSFVDPDVKHPHPNMGVNAWVDIASGFQPDFTALSKALESNINATFAQGLLSALGDLEPAASQQSYADMNLFSAFTFRDYNAILADRISEESALTEAAINRLFGGVSPASPEPIAPALSSLWSDIIAQVDADRKAIAKMFKDLDSIAESTKTDSKEETQLDENASFKHSQVTSDEGYEYWNRIAA